MLHSQLTKPAHAIETKRCSECKQILDASSFYKLKKSTDGLQNTCRQCQRERKMHLKANIVTPTKKFCKECKLTKPMKQFIRSSLYADGLAPKCLQCFWTVTERILEVFHAARHNSKLRGKRNTLRGAFDLTPQLLMEKFVKQGGKCYVSGMDLVFTPHHLQTLSLERIDNTQGELNANTVLVCAMFNHFCQMTREKLYYILHHNDDPMDDIEIEQNLSKTSVFENLSTSNMAIDRKRGFTPNLNAEDLRAQFRSQHGRCAYSDVKMYVGTNIPTFQMSVERIDRSNPHTAENIVLIIRELNVGGDINLNRDIVQSWKHTTCIPEMFDVGELRAKWDSEAVVSKADRTCIECQITKDSTQFEHRVEGTFYVRCRHCRNARQYAAHKARHPTRERKNYGQSKRCSGCQKRRLIKFFAAANSKCIDCEHLQEITICGKRRCKDHAEDGNPKRLRSG